MSVFLARSMKVSLASTLLLGTALAYLPLQVRAATDIVVATPVAAPYTNSNTVVYIYNGGSWDFTGGDVTNSGTSQINVGIHDTAVGAPAFVTDTGTLTISSPYKLINNATIHVYAAGTAQTDITNSNTTINDGIWTGNVTDNTGAGTINNNSGGTWTGSITDNHSTINNNLSGTWNGGITNNHGTITNAGTWTAGTITDNDATGTISNTGSWTGGVTDNHGTINNSKTWGGNITDNHGTINNNTGGTWTGTVIDNGTSTGGTINNNATWTGGVTNNHGTINNNKTWNGVVTDNNGTINNNSGGIWNGNITNTATVNNIGTWNGAGGTGTQSTVVNNATGKIYNTGTLNGDVTSNAGLIYNGQASDNTIVTTAVWKGDATSNTGTITTLATWNAPNFIVNDAAGTIVAGNGTTASTINTPLLTNNGTITAKNLLTINGYNANPLTFTNNGIFQVDSTSTNAVVAINGTVTNSSTGTIDNSANGAKITVTTNGNTPMTNNGTINMVGGNRTNNIFAVNGDYTTSGSTLRLDTSIASSASDKLTVSGNVLNTGGGATQVNVTSAGVGTMHADSVMVTAGGDMASGTFQLQNGGVDTGSTNSPFAISGGQFYSQNGFVQQWFGQSDAKTYVMRSTLDAAMITPIGVAVPGMVNAAGLLFDDPVSTLIKSPAKPRAFQFMIGAWAQTKGVNITQNASGTLTNNSNNSPIQHVDTKLASKIWGVQAGIDIGLYNIEHDGWRINVGPLFGMSSGNASSNGQKFDISDTFFGAYVALGTDGHSGLSFDALLRRDNYKLTYKTTNIALLASTDPDGKFDGHGVSGLVNLRYRFAQAIDSWYVEPGTTLLFSKANLNSLGLTFGTAAGTADFNKASAMVARFGVKAGYNYLTNAMVFSPYVMAAFSHDFKGNSNVLFSNTATNFTFLSTPARNYTQLGGGLEFSGINPGLSGFLQAESRLGAGGHGYAFNAGLRGQF